MNNLKSSDVINYVIELEKENQMLKAQVNPELAGLRSEIAILKLEKSYLEKETPVNVISSKLPETLEEKLRAYGKNQVFKKLVYTAYGVSGELGNNDEFIVHTTLESYMKSCVQSSDLFSGREIKTICKEELKESYEIKCTNKHKELLRKKEELLTKEDQE